MASSSRCPSTPLHCLNSALCSVGPLLALKTETFLPLSVLSTKNAVGAGEGGSVVQHVALEQAHGLVQGDVVVVVVALDVSLPDTFVRKISLAASLSTSPGSVVLEFSMSFALSLRRKAINGHARGTESQAISDQRHPAVGIIVFHCVMNLARP